LNVHLKSPDHPPIDDLAAWEMLLAEKGRAGTAPPKLRDAIARARLGILNEQKKRLARENQQAAKQLMPVADAIRHAQQAGTHFMAELERFEREIPPVISGQPCAEIAKQLSVHVERIRVSLKAKLNSIGQ
jgi:hypothetical protein